MGSAATAPDGRAGTLAAVDAGYASLRDAVQSLSAAEGIRAGAVGGWSVAQTLAHISGWLGEGETALLRMAQGERPTPQGVEYSNVDAWNAKFVEVHTRATLAEALTAFGGAFGAFRAALAALPEERFRAGGTANSIAQRSCRDHFGEHEAAIRQALGG